MTTRTRPARSAVAASSGSITVPITFESSNDAFAVYLLRAPCDRVLMPLTPRAFPHTTCVARFRVRFSGCVNLATL
jgi:hypothetical protein